MSRLERIRELIKTEVAQIIQTKITDSRIGFVSVTDVELDNDISIAKIFVSCLGDEKAKRDTMYGLKSAKSHIRKLLAGNISLRYVPDIRFVLDESLERGSKLIAKINELVKDENKQ